ncbi:MAG: type III polyketide synthase [Planctomycetes bacterium]|nr:type III polyketide synthase [Planctomycetota bacterium]MCC7170491.1 type III polyketide synthase [Planctomycetota bacterium]
MSFVVHGLGLALPPTRLEQHHALALARRMWSAGEDSDRAQQALYRRAGVATRHVVLDPTGAAPLRLAGAEPARIPTTAERMLAFERLAPPLAIASARAALEQARLPASAITHVITVSCTGATAPGIEFALIDALGLSRGVARTHVGFMGCYAALSGLRVARAFCAADPDAVALVSCVELCSLHFHYGTDPDRLVANALFSDGAAAIVGSACPRPGAWSLRACGSTIVPATADAMSWTVRDHGFAMSLSARVPDVIEHELATFVDAWLDRLGLRRDALRSFAVHPGGPRVLDAVERALGLDRAATAVSRAVLSELGNLSSPTVLFILDRLRAIEAPTPCLALAFGPGLVVEAALFDRTPAN